jgi:hypothetical protein
MPKHRVFGEYGRDQDGQQTRTVHTPGGNTHVGAQTFVTTPNCRNEAWLLKHPDKEARRKDNAQSICDFRKKTKRENKTGMRARVSLAVRAKSAGVGSAEAKKLKALSREVLRAEQSVEDRDALNERQNHRQRRAIR